MDRQALLLQAHEELGGGVLAPSRTLRLRLDVHLLAPAPGPAATASAAAAASSATAATSASAPAAAKLHRLYLFSDAALLAAPRRSSLADAPRAVARLLDAGRHSPDAPPPPRRRFTARRWLSLDATAARAADAVLTLSPLAEPGAVPPPPPEPPLALRCASEAAAAEAAAALVALQEERRELSRKSGYKSAGEARAKT